MNRWTRLAAVAVATLAVVGCGGPGSDSKAPYPANGMRTVGYSGRISSTQNGTVVFARLPKQATSPDMQENHRSLGIAPSFLLSDGVVWELPYHPGASYKATMSMNGLYWSNEVKSAGLPRVAGQIHYPPPNATSVDRLPLIEWEPVFDAVSYLVILQEVPASGTIVAPDPAFICETTQTRWQVATSTSSIDPIFFHREGTDLKANTTYLLEVIALDKSGWGLSSAPESVFETGN